MKELQIPALRDEGRFANRLIHYMVGRHLAEAWDVRLATHPWIGECLFDLNDSHVERPVPYLPFAEIEKGFWGPTALPPFFAIPHRIVDPLFNRQFVQKLFKWRAFYEEKRGRVQSHKAVIHVRRGDFCSLPDFPVVPVHTLLDNAEQHGFSVSECILVREESPLNTGLFPWPFEFLEDFFTLMQADNIFVYPRSSFSQLAALMGNGNIYMPYDYSTDPARTRFVLHEGTDPVVFPTRNNGLT